MPTDLDLLRELCAASAPTGFEAPAQEVVRRRLAPIATRRLLGRRSKNTLAKRGAALPTGEAPARR